MNDKFQNILKKVKSIAATKRGKISIISGGSIVIIAVISTIIAVNINSTHALKTIAQDLKVQNMKVNTSSTETSSATASNSSSPASSSAPATASSGKVSASAQSAAASAPTAANVPVTSVDFTNRYVTLKAGAACQLTAKITPVNATDKSLSWTTSNSSVATVDSSGVITAHAAGKAYVRAASTDGQRDTCTVTVTSGSGSTGSSGKSYSGSTGSTGNAGGSGSVGSGSGSGDSHVANYQGVNKTMTFTDEITGIRQTVEFLGMGAGYCEVAGGTASLKTTSALGIAHCGPGKATLSGPVSKTSNAGVAQDGNDSNLVFDNLTAGTYTLTLTAHDGTVVAKYSFTVDSSGNVK